MAMARASSGLSYPKRFYVAASYAGFGGSPKSPSKAAINKGNGLITFLGGMRELNNVAVDQDIYNLQKACEEKDATIKELTAVVKASDIAGSKRITELEDIIKRKNSIITKMKKDMMVLEQKVLHFTRLNRPSFSTSNSNSKKLPAMSPNLLYDMDSSTSPSSSDSNSPVGNGKGQQQSKTLLVGQDQKIRGSNYAHSILHQGVIAEASQRSSRPEKENLVQRPVSPLKEKSMNQGADSGVGQDQKIRGSNYAHSIFTKVRLLKLVRDH